MSTGTPWLRSGKSRLEVPVETSTQEDSTDDVDSRVTELDNGVTAAESPVRFVRSIDIWAEEDNLMASSLDAGDSGQKFTGDPNGPPLKSLRQAWAARQVQLKMKNAAAIAALNDTDKFHLLVDLTAGGARAHASQLQERLQQELNAENEILREEYEEEVAAWTAADAAYEAMTAEERGKTIRPVRPTDIVYREDFRDPVGKLWHLFERLYPQKSAARIVEFREFAPKSGGVDR